MFKLVSNYLPSGDQPHAIDELVDGIIKGKKNQVLLGATGTGKTFTIANVIAKTNKPTLVLAHNKTLAGQLYSEFKELFPENRVEYFVSYYDYYQPEAYVPSKDLYIEKLREVFKNEQVLMSNLEFYDAAASTMTLHNITAAAKFLSAYLETDPHIEEIKEKYKNDLNFKEEPANAN